MFAASRIRHQYGLTLLLVGLWPVVSARADQIISQGTNYVGVTLVGLEDGRLQFRDHDGRLRSTWIDEMELLIVDRGGLFADFNQAERFLAHGEPQRAIVRYRRALRLGEEFWKDLITVRLLQAYDLAGQLDKATLSFIRVLRAGLTGPRAAARLFPKGYPARRDSRVRGAVERLDATLSPDVSPSQRVLLELLRFDLLHHYGNPRTGKTARTLASLAIPAAVRSEQVYTILTDALTLLAQKQNASEVLALLDRAIRECPRKLLPGFLLLRGRALAKTAVTRDDWIRACWPLLRIPIHFPDDPLAAEGLYEAAMILERIGRRDKAIALLRECLEKQAVGGETRQQATAALQRLQSAGKQNG